ncbi:uncharacterized protein LOC113311934 [Papaver somniferum]|uniref:uncharacterized protein LOC113311934 n=1 Tax=Papaver somniferum TaxID=3469 RepID=UPI000E6F4F89|nr:uncharacterized protein LOC113311934 [Papaver somniferum]
MESISDLNKPWLAIGDFNSIVSQDEKIGGMEVNRRSMQKFNNCLNNYELIQAPKSGLMHSWSNCQHGDMRILCNLERAIYNHKWFQMHENWSYKVGLRIASDHSPLLGGGAIIPKPSNAPFKFQKMWLTHPVFGTIHVKIKEAEEEVQKAIVISDQNPHDIEALDNLVAAENDYNSKKVQLNTMLKQKDRIKWVKEGSANTESENHCRNSCATLQAKILISRTEDAESLLEEIPKVITDEDQKMLDALLEAEEIKSTIFSMDPDSSPGPDGFSGCFYRACWKIIQYDVVQAVQFCWRRKFIPKGLNSNFLVLLPKTEGAKTPNQFRPIGMSNVSFKIFTKIINTRMISLMQKLITPQQVAYIKGRSIQEKIILASEMVNDMKKKRRGGNIGLKLDISQDYDSCHWLRVLFESARLSVMVNGGPHGFFSVGRGLRQGNPLSPTLFVIMEDVLSRSIHKKVAEGLIIPMIVRKGIHPTHLFFADDVFLLCNRAKKSITNLMKLLDDYQKGSGQIINKTKSKIFIDGNSVIRKNQIKEILQMELSTFPDKYLGVILSPGRVKVSTVWLMVELIQIKLAAWKGKLLSFQDRLVLIKSVLFSIPIYNMVVYKCPASIIKVCEKVIRNFLWSGDGDVRKYTILAWRKWAWEALKENIRWCIGNGQKVNVWHDNWIGDAPLNGNINTNTYVKVNEHLKVAHFIQNGRIPKSFDDVWNNARNKSPIVREAWITSACSVIREVWFQKNKKFIEEIKPNELQFKNRIKKLVYEGGYKMKGNRCNQAYDSQVIAFLTLGIRYNKFHCIKTCYWSPPPMGYTMFCCDGSSFGNPGAAGLGVVVRNYLCQVIGALSGGISITTNFVAENYAVFCAVELAGEWELQNIIICSDSKTIIEGFIKGQTPWFIRMRWKKAVSRVSSIIFQHCFRETNFSVDTTAKRGARLAAGERQLILGRPNFLIRVEMPNVEYFRFI